MSSLGGSLLRIARKLTSGPALGLVFCVVVGLLLTGPLVQVDRSLNYSWRVAWPDVRPVMAILVWLGQRAFCVPVLLTVAAYLSHRRRSWEPLVVAVAATLALNVVVGTLKLLTARGSPLSGDPQLLGGGQMFPSGHAANAVFVYGLAAYLLQRYGDKQRWAGAMLALTWMASTAMLITGLYFQWHWFSDLAAGFLAGGVVLRSTVYAHKTGRSYLVSGAERAINLVRPARRSTRSDGMVHAQDANLMRPSGAWQRQERNREPGTDDRSHEDVVPLAHAQQARSSRGQD